MRRLLWVLLLAVPAFGQQAFYQLPAPLPNAKFYVCGVPAILNPCSNPANIYKDQGLTQLISQPVQLGIDGNFGFWTNPAQYTIQIQAPYDFVYIISLGGAGGGGSSQPFLLRTNSPNGTTLNQLVTYDTANLDPSGIATVQNAAVGSKGVIGVCIAGCGTTGVATIGTYLAAQCITDNQSHVGDLVSASIGSAGQCDDYGAAVSASVQTVGRISKANTGVGTLSLVDFFLGDLLAPGSTNGSGTVTNCVTSGSVAYYASIGTVVSCDPLFTTDGNGNWKAKSGTTTDTAHAGYINYIQGPAPPTAPVNGVQTAAQTSVTGYTLLWPNGANTGCLFGTNSSGTVTLSYQNPCGGAATPTIGAPTAPTLSNNNAAGARSITYLVQGCEDGATCADHTVTSSTANISNANASPQVLLKTYGDTLYGPRCFDVYVTADTGARTGVPGRIANCVGKQFIDTGANANGIAATNTNTTALDPNGLSNPLPGCNKIPGAPWGIDGPPCTPNALDDEMAEQFGNPADANSPFWAWQNQNSCTATWTGGMIELTCPGRSASHSINCLVMSVPATPYTFETVLYYNANNTNGNMDTGMGWFETASGKYEMFGPIQSGANPYALQYSSWTNSTTPSFGLYESGQGFNPIYIKLQNDGANLNYFTSPDGITYQQQRTEAKASFFTTAPDKIGICLDTAVNASNVDFDYWRRTQ